MNARIKPATPRLVFMGTPDFAVPSLQMLANDYDVVAAKIGVSRTFFNHLQPYAEVGWYDNNFSASKYKFASKEFSGDIVAVAGVRWNF